MYNFSWDYSQKFFHKKCDKENFPGPSHPHGCGGGGSRKKLLKKPGKQKGDLPVARPWELKKNKWGLW